MKAPEAGTAGQQPRARAHAVAAAPAMPAPPTGASRAWTERLQGELPRRLLEVAVLDGQLDVMEHYGDGDAERLVAVLERLGLRTRLRFHSPCG